MSLCDKCFDPGRCCKHLKFYSGGEVTFWLEEVMPIDEQLRNQMHPEDKGRPQPFAVKSIDSIYENAEGQKYAYMTFQCTRLLPDGRCGIYDQRPWLCRQFPEGEDQLCVHFKGAEADDLPTAD